MSAASKWADLAPRIGSAAALVLLCGVEVYLGGLPFSILVWVACGLMTWELARMFGARSPVALGLLSAAVLMLAEKLPLLLNSNVALLPLILAAVIVGMGQVARDRWLYGVFAAWILAASYAFLVLRHLAGLEWFIWLVAIVVVSDIAGYFAGRLLGGPKFWPKVSPKKTWSGTVAGWVGAAIIGVIFAKTTGAGEPLSFYILLSIVAAFAGQMGDIVESAVKRRVGVKDSSNLIPGHGGLLDRFDAMLGASAVVFVLWLFSALPGAA
ncbi:phosphatidate cytidylyltransferase [Roseovarius faecimaris]|uniref:Phosphatidate cytidylyltransferase n=1 Tax=Roseovarius faecimaris TaxID=2494550 RepID=A0A6I6IQS1_9RHOB|nr:phosphatidate cytidylyltransferase [Roseovarius faecimaris]QGX98582.1 phosphatidate cytidylyltransferase [Roseovarius faecimaris]